MTQTTKVFVGMLVIAAVLVIGFFTLGPPPEPVYATPEDVFKAAVRASEKDDVKTWCQCLTDESRDMFAVRTMVQIPIFGAGDDPKSPMREFETLFARHGFKPAFLAKVREQAAAVFRNPETSVDDQLAFVNAALGPVSNRQAFCVDLLKAMMSSGFFKTSPLDNWREASLKDVRKSGNTATGTLTIGGDRGEPVQFRKQGEGWRIDLLAEAGRPPRLPMGHPPMR